MPVSWGMTKYITGRTGLTSNVVDITGRPHWPNWVSVNTTSAHRWRVCVVCRYCAGKEWRRKRIAKQNVGEILLEIGLPDFHSRNTWDFWTLKMVPMVPERCSCCCSYSTSWGSYCYHIFLSLSLCRFSTDHNQNVSHILIKICCVKLPWGYFDLGCNYN